MKAWICSNPNAGVDALQWQEVPTPEPGPGQARVAIQASSLNFPDILIVQNKYQFKPEPPFVPGSEFAGIVDAVGPGVTNVKVGDRVCVLNGTGGFGSHAIAPAEKLVPMPPGMSFEDGAAFLMTYGTTQHALVDRGELKAGETCLVLGAAGGVGSAAIQIAKALGAKVIAAASTDEKCAQCRAMGADETINYTSTNIREALKTLTGGKGPDVVYDPVGSDLAEPVFRSIAWRGRYLVIGFAGGTIPSLPLNLSLLKGASIVGVFWGDYTRREPANFQRDLKQLAQWYAEGKVKPVLDVKMSLKDLHAAYARMNARQVVGKLVLTQD